MDTTRKALVILVCAVCAGLLVGFLFTIQHRDEATPLPPVSTATSSPIAVTIQGGKFYRGGQPWYPKGVQMDAFVAPAGERGAEVQAAYDHWGQGILDAAKTWDINFVTFMVSQGGLDPEDKLYNGTDGKYISDLQSGVALAEKNGFTVIIRIGDGFTSGEDDPALMPTAATGRALLTIAKLFGSDPAVMVDDYNLPKLGDLDAPTPLPASEWDVWLHGGPDPDNPSVQVAGVQDLLDEFRNAGGKNVFLAEGLAGAHRFDGVPPVNDPLNQFAYNLDTSLKAGSFDTPALWQQDFGFLTDLGKPVIDTVWADLLTGPDPRGKHNPWCTSDAQDPNKLPQQLIDYLSSKNIGFGVYAFDNPNPTVVTDFNGTPSSFDGVKCSQDGGGAGTLVKNFFLSRGNTY